MIFCSSLSSAQLKVFIDGLFSFNQDIPAFKEHLRDFLVQIRVSGFLLQSPVFADKCNSILHCVWVDPKPWKITILVKSWRKIAISSRFLTIFKCECLVKLSILQFLQLWMNACSWFCRQVKWSLLCKLEHLSILDTHLQILGKTSR